LPKKEPRPADLRTTNKSDPSAPLGELAPQAPEGVPVPRSTDTKIYSVYVKMHKKIKKPVIEASPGFKDERD
jgi:hypothetical protein